jgi:hypothetical protein
MGFYLSAMVALGCGLFLCRVRYGYLLGRYFEPHKAHRHIENSCSFNSYLEKNGLVIGLTFVCPKIESKRKHGSTTNFVESKFLPLTLVQLGAPYLTDLITSSIR